MNGGVLDGNGRTLSVEGSGDYSAILTSGGTIKDLTLDDGFRGIFLADLTEDVYIDDVKISGDDVVYCINTGTMVNGVYNMYVTNSTLNGWTSFDGLASASFTNCSFGQGEYFDDVYGRVLKPYVTTTLKDCSFVQGLYIDLSVLGDGCTITLENCTVNGENLTADNYATLLEAIELPIGKALTDCVIFK